MKVLISFLFFSLNSVLAQPNVDFKGELNKLYEFVGINIQFSAADVKAKRDGKVLMKFKVLNNSEIDSILVVNSVSQSIDSEVLRVLSLTSGNWTTDTSDSYLLEVNCSLLYDGKLNYTKLKNRLRRAVKENKVDKIEYYLDAIRREDPYDTENLDQLISFYQTQNKEKEAEKIIELKSDISYFFNKGNIIGR